MMKSIKNMTADELRSELEDTEKSLTYIFDEAKWNDDPALGSAYYDFQAYRTRLKNRLFAVEAVKA